MVKLKPGSISHVIAGICRIRDHALFDGESLRRSKISCWSSDASWIDIVILKADPSSFIPKSCLLIADFPCPAIGDFLL